MVDKRQSLVDYEKVMRDTLSLFTIDIEQKASVVMISETLDIQEYQITHIKAFLGVAETLETRSEHGGGKGSGRGGQISYWKMVKTADETMGRLRALGLSGFTSKDRKRIVDMQRIDEITGLQTAVDSDDHDDKEAEEFVTAHPSKKNELLAIFREHSDKRGKVKSLTWKMVQNKIGDGVGLHSVFHLCRSLQRDGAIRFLGLPTKLTTAHEAARAYVDITVVIKKSKKHKGSSPAYVSKASQASPNGNGQQPASAVYVPYLSTAGPVPPTPLTDKIIERVDAMHRAREALIEAELTPMVLDLDDQIAAVMTGQMKEFIALVEWAKKTSDQARINQAKEKRTVNDANV